VGDIELTSAELAKMQADSGTPHLPTQETYWFRKAMSGEGPRAFDWTDKPHRLVFDLCRIIEAQAALSRPSVSVDEVSEAWATADHLEGRLALAYIGDCKCGQCYLVPAPLIEGAVQTIRAFALASRQNKHGERDNG